jgi:hypothetical protein
LVCRIKIISLIINAADYMYLIIAGNQGCKIYYRQKLMEEMFQHLLRKAVYFLWLMMLLPDDMICVEELA